MTSPASGAGVTNTVTHLVYSHHHADHAAAASLFDRNVVRVGHEETRRLLLRDGDPARPQPALDRLIAPYHWHPGSAGRVGQELD